FLSTAQISRRTGISIDIGSTPVRARIPTWCIAQRRRKLALQLTTKWPRVVAWLWIFGDKHYLR
ncbi:MAG TPA: hypothetical protein VF760_08315, partial [Xanthobacteraceae bacterium]